ncbi:MAG: hypothetical protein U0516_01670 [Candidatus Saccharibacteria bacterium]
MSYISLIIAVIVISVLIYFLMKSKASDKRVFNPDKMNRTSSQDNSVTSGVNVELVKTKWSEISAMQNSGAAGLKNALIEADKLLDYVMIQKGFSGETMGERLKSGGSAFSNLNAIWAAHKLRNQMAHEIEHDVVATQFKQAITDLGQGIRDLGVSL